MSNAKMSIHKQTMEFVSKPLFEERVILANDASYPRVSIVTPSYNQAEFLERTILSVLNQNYPNLEYIIIDGGSTDGSIEIIKKYQGYLAYWVSQKDRGLSEGINKGFKKSTGEFLAWLNSDDTYLPGTIRWIADYLNQYPKTAMIYGRCNMIDVNDRVFQEVKTAPFNLLDYIFGLFTIPQQATFWRRDIFLEAGLLNIENHTCMDYELWINFARSKANIKYVNKPLANFRLHPRSISGSGRLIIEYRNDKTKIQTQTLGYKPTKFRIFSRRLFFMIKHPMQHIKYYWSILYNRARIHNES